MKYLYSLTNYVATIARKLSCAGSRRLSGRHILVNFAEEMPEARSFSALPD